MTRPRSSGRFDRRLVAPMVLGSVLNPVNSSMLAVALVPIGLALGAPPSATIWLVSALYLATAVVTGGFFLAEAYRLLRAAKAGAGPTVLKPMRLFHFSISYVAILFLGVALDPLLYLSVTGR